MLLLFLIFSITVVTLLTTCLQLRKRENANNDNNEVYVPVLRNDAKKIPQKTAKDKDKVKLEKPDKSTAKLLKPKVEQSDATNPGRSDTKTASERVRTSSTESSHDGPTPSTLTQLDEPPKEELGNIKLVPRKPRPAKSVYVSDELRTERFKDSIISEECDSYASDVTLPCGNDTTLRNVPSLITDMGTVAQRRSDENVILASNDFGALNDSTDADGISEVLVSGPQDSLASISRGSYYVTRVPAKQSAGSTFVNNINMHEFEKKKIIHKV